MRNKYKGIVPAILVVIACLFCLSSCTDKKPKTIVMEDSVSQGSAAENQKTDNRKVIQYNSFNIIDNEPVDEQLFGWVDENNAADIVYKEKSDKKTIESVNYRYHFTKEIMPVTADIENYSLSPDGSNLAYVQKTDTLHYIVKDINTGTDQMLLEMDRNFLINGVGIGWSNNGRYLTFSIYDFYTGTYICTVFDLLSGESRPITLHIDPEANYMIQSDILCAEVSDDGTRLLISAENNTNSLSLIYDMPSGAFIITKAYPISQGFIMYPRFYSENELMFVDLTSDKLYLYDIKNEQTAQIGEDIFFYKLSNDKKSIVYAKYLSDNSIEIYTGELLNGKISGEKPVYSGFLPEDGWWTQDKSKILLRGSFIHINQTITLIDEADNMLENIIIELN